MINQPLWGYTKSTPSGGGFFNIRDKIPYRELGDQYLDKRNQRHLIRHHTRRLEALGFKVELQELPQTT
jgi:hypothetical protein